MDAAVITLLSQLSGLDPEAKAALVKALNGGVETAPEVGMLLGGPSRLSDTEAKSFLNQSRQELGLPVNYTKATLKKLYGKRAELVGSYWKYECEAEAYKVGGRPNLRVDPQGWFDFYTVVDTKMVAFLKG